MPFDPEDHGRNLERWLSEDLVMFGVVGLERIGGGHGMGGLMSSVGGVRQSVLMSAGTSFQDGSRRRITVTSHRRDDANFEMRRDHAPVNTFFAVQRDTGSTSRSPRRPEEPPDFPEFAWVRTTIDIDGDQVAFDLCRFDNGFWTAVGRVTEAEITIDSRGVSLDGLQLERLNEPPPVMPPPPEPPPATSRRFPDDLFNAPSPLSVPASDAVSLTFGQRFSEDGQLAGTIGADRVELTLELPNSASTARGSVAGEPVNVTWTLSDNSTGDPELPATLQGTIGTKRVEVHGAFTLTPGFWFSKAVIRGTIAGIELEATVQPASGAFGRSSTVVANGTLGDESFEVYAAVDGGLERGVIRGTYGDRPVHLDAHSENHSETAIAGRSSAPPWFTVLITASLLFFV